VQIVRYRLTERIAQSQSWLSYVTSDVPAWADVLYHASAGVLERALAHQVDVVLVVSAMYLHPDAIILLRRAGLRVVVLFTETPYDIEHELRVAALVDGCWVMERTAVDAYRAINPRCGYLPHAWHPAIHRPDAQLDDRQMPAHDVVFVGSPFPERVAYLRAIDWTGLDVALYGFQRDDGLQLDADDPLSLFARPAVPNASAAALYRRAALALNLYRDAPGAESMNPRAYELAACGCPFMTTPRAESRERFGAHVDDLSSDPVVAGQQIRRWLDAPSRRQRASAALPACVVDESWIARATSMLADLQTLCDQQREPATALA
jgi:spore maturation protein CgeB